MSPGDTHNLGELYFYIPRDDSVDLSKHWLVVQMTDTAIDVPEEKRRKGYAYAHSAETFSPAIIEYAQFSAPVAEARREPAT
jgi:hypothetical protein